MGNFIVKHRAFITFIMFCLGFIAFALIQEKREKEAINVKYTPTARCQWDIGGIPMDFEKIATFKLVQLKNSNRIMYEFIMGNGIILRFHVGHDVSVQDITNEVRVCTSGRVAAFPFLIPVTSN